MLIRHGSLAVDVPDDWRDESTLLFVAPARKPALPTATPIAATGEAVSVRFALAGSLSARDVLRQMQSAQSTIDSSFKAIGDRAFTTALGDGLLAEQETQAGGISVKQLVSCVIIGPLAVVATASAPAVEFEKVRPRLMQILSSLRTLP